MSAVQLSNGIAADTITTVCLVYAGYSCRIRWLRCHIRCLVYAGYAVIYAVLYTLVTAVV